MATNHGSYGGDEEPTPADPGHRISHEARVFANLGLEYNHASICMWNAARLLDTTAGDNRSALLANLIAELSSIIEATTKARASVTMKQGEAAK